MSKKALIIGGGFAGCAAAKFLSDDVNWDVTLVERAKELGGGNKTRWWGGHPHTLGPRHFITQNEKVWEHLTSILPMRRCQEHICLSYIESENAFYNYPIHVDDVPLMPEADKIQNELAHVEKNFEVPPKNLEEFWRKSVGDTLYSKFIDTYSKKMWMLDDNKLIDDFSWSPKGVALKDGPREVWDTAISAFPQNFDGYDPYFSISTQNSKVLLDTSIERWDIINKRVFFNSEWHVFDVIINTISPDALFDHCYETLRYVGRDLHLFVLPVEHVFPENVYFLYYPNGEKFTRLIEYKKFTRFKSPTSLLSMEIPSLNGKYYPLPISSEFSKAQKYFDLMPDDVFSIGRAGSYLYRIDIDDCIAQAMDVVSKIRG
ncbi:UDP-galactopyranose mutase [SAR116 cluster alpha proteobacterium HIMB100]|nr:UDP-galactopyranose mutase [SAR116 cluster alpha proteobacterium HIMB100]